MNKKLQKTMIITGVVALALTVLTALPVRRGIKIACNEPSAPQLQSFVLVTERQAKYGFPFDFYIKPIPKACTPLDVVNANAARQIKFVKLLMNFVFWVIVVVGAKYAWRISRKRSVAKPNPSKPIPKVKSP